MNIHRLTRNPGWSRLFWVLSILWWLGLLVILAVNFADNPEPTDWNDYFSAFESNEVITPLSVSQSIGNPPPKGAVLLHHDDGIYRIREGKWLDVILPDGTVIADIPETTTKADLVNRLITFEKNRTKEQHKALALEYLPFLFAPLVILFSMRLLRYVIEGFSAEE